MSSMTGWFGNTEQQVNWERERECIRTKLDKLKDLEQQTK